MKKLQLFFRLFMEAWKAVCQQLWLLAALFLLFLLLPGAAGKVGTAMLSQGVDFSGITLAVTGPQGDDTGAALEKILGSMQDVRRYATLRQMSWEEAAAALDAGEVTAVLVLPERFVGGVLDGTNPDVTLVVSGDRPLEALLTAWVGESAAQLLTGAQRGIYAVLELYPGEQASELSWEQVKNGVNLAYVSHVLNRQELFRMRSLQAAGSMELGMHYALSLVIFLAMALPPLFCPMLRQELLPFRRRLRSLGHGAGIQYAGCFAACWSVVFLLTAVPLRYLTGHVPADAAVLALFAAGWGCLLCLLTRSASGCGGAAVAGAVALVFLSGGILPSPLLPQLVRTLGAVSPVGMLRQLLYAPLSQWSRQGWALPGAALWTLGTVLLGWLLLGRQLREEGGR